MTPDQVAAVDALPSDLLGRMIREHRRSVGLTQLALGQMSGVTAAYVSRIEDGQRRPSPVVFDLFLEAFKLDAETFLGTFEDGPRTVKVAFTRDEFALISEVAQGLGIGVGRFLAQEALIRAAGLKAAT